MNRFTPNRPLASAGAGNDFALVAAVVSIALTCALGTIATLIS